MSDDRARERAAERERARRRDLVFGRALPDTTGDERDDEPPEGSNREEWLRRNVPPHHG